ncbi:MAG: class II aldolase/adducin family protein, partial [Verrucomicrobiota bacterium]|nr:class II aldolase/adducin family protein [Verrucomicrobiota bacterium]
MKSLWNDNDAKKFNKSLLSKRVYTSRLLGQNSDLVLHGGGNTSVKIRKKDFFGNSADYLYVKGSGCDLETIEEKDFSGCKMSTLLKLSDLDLLSDTEMVNQCRSSMIDPNSSNPSIEALVHAVIPYRFVDHTHADAILSLTNSPNGKQNIIEVFGDKVIIVPYVMPGFDLAKEVKKQVMKADMKKVEGMILMNHGIFTFHDDAKKSYQLMIKLVTKAERFIKKSIGSKKSSKSKSSPPKASDLSLIRKIVSEWRGCPVNSHFDNSDLACEFANLKNVTSVASRGPLTPDHVIRTKRIPLVIASDIKKSIDKYAVDYIKYFNKYSSNEMTMLDPAPRWAVLPGKGILTFGCNKKELTIVK